jgi:hypothetical protein
MIRITLFLLVVVGSLALVRAWWDGGHAAVAEAACSALPDDMPKFFRAAAKQLGYLSADPDRWKNPSCKHLRAAESPDHFIDLEDYQGKELPADRWKAIALLQELKADPSKAGMLPYAIMENYDRLSVGFYDFRKNEQKEVKDEQITAAIKAKCILYAGILSHLTGDSVMPLHTTRDYDGRRDKDGNMQQKGIHAKIDAFPERNGLTAELVARDVKANKIDDVWKHVLKVIDESHALIEKCYELDKAGAFDKPTKESRDLILARCRAGAQFTADLWYTAWIRSATMPKHY